MATQKWIAGSGQGLTWGSAFGTEINSVVNGNAIISSIAIDNSSVLDVFADVSISLGSITPTGASFIGIYLMPLNQEGSSYGDGRFGSSAAGPPGSVYAVGNIPCNNAAGVVTGAILRVPLPPGSLKFCLYNSSGVTLAASANTVKYRTYNLSTA